ncbi:MAG: hypothetical protein KDK37_04800 [Leptospiraceae bacterium]|nr:hypothetical protein [Leptospiraceae bacterium]
MAAIFPPRTSPIPMDLAPSSSLDGIYIDGEDSPADSRQLTIQLETLAPGGIAVMTLSREYWTVAGLRQACEGTGFRILFLSRVKSAQKVRFTREGLPVPASWWARIFNAKRLASFPALSFRSGKALFVILQKRFSPSLSSRSGISVVTLMPEDRSRAAAMLVRWDSFLREKGFDEAQLVYVEDNPLDPPAMELYADSIRKVDHYRPTGPYGALRSGLAFCKGRKVIVDFSRGEVDPALCMPLLNRYLEAEKAMGKDHFVVQAIDYRMRHPYGWIKSLILRLIAGTNYPDSPIRIYPARTAALLADLHPEEVKRYPLLLSMTVKRNGGKFLNERVNVKSGANALSLTLFGMILNYLRLRAGKLIGYLALSAIALFSLPSLHAAEQSVRAALKKEVSLQWVMSGTEVLLRARPAMVRDPGHLFASGYLVRALPGWEDSLNGYKNRFLESGLWRWAMMLFQATLASYLFYILASLLLFRRPGHRAWIILFYAAHLLALLLWIGWGMHDTIVAQLESGLDQMSSLLHPSAQFWQRSLFFLPALALEAATAVVVLFLFRRKYF